MTVPGALDGWEELVSRFGTRTLGDLLQPAIRHAEEGFPVSEVISVQWKQAEAKLARHPATAATYLVDGKRAPEHGEVFRSPDFAKTLRKIAETGTDVFYRGEIAQAIHDFMEAEGGFVTRMTLAAHDSTWGGPHQHHLPGRRDLPDPPELQGFVALEMLNILEGYGDLADLGHNSAAYLHRLIEAKKLAFADRDAYLGDPEHMRVPVETLISKEYAATRRASIEPERAAREVAPG